MAKFVDEAGQQQVWDKILEYLEGSDQQPGKVDKVAGKILSTNDFSDALKTKLDNIAENANNYILPVAGQNITGGVRTTSEVVSSAGYTATPIIGGVPYYKNTDTTYTPATSSADGLMSASDKAKLDGLASDLHNYTLPTAGKNQLGGVKTTSSVTSSSGYTPVPIIGGVPYYKDTTYGAMTSSSPNYTEFVLVPAPKSADQTKYLRGDGTWQSMYYYELPTATDTTLGGVRLGTSFSMASGALELTAITNAEIDAMMAE